MGMAADRKRGAKLIQVSFGKFSPTRHTKDLHLVMWPSPELRVCHPPQRST